MLVTWPPAPPGISVLMVPRGQDGGVTTAWHWLLHRQHDIIWAAASRSGPEEAALLQSFNH